MEFNTSEISTYYQSRVPQMAQPDRKEWRGKCPVHNGKDDNFAVDTSTGMAFCHSACNRGWDMISLEMELDASDFAKAKQEVFRIVGKPLPNWQERDIEATFDYTDETGKLLYQVVRKTGKRFSQRRPVEGQENRWIWGLGSASPVPFRLPALLKAELAAIAEGEKDVLNLTRVGWTATCNNGGAGNFKPNLVPYFAGKHVAIFPDNDEPGRKHAEGVAKLLHPVAASVRIVEIPDLPLKGDVSDYLATGKTGDDLYALYEQTQDWNPEWKFTADVPNENDRYLRTFGQFVQEVGGHEAFWKSIEIEGLPTPFESLTRKLGGMRAGEVYVLAANQGQGKTSLGLQFAIAALERRGGVLIFSMEMGHRDVFQRVAAIDARVDLSQFRRLKRFHHDAPNLIEAEAALRIATDKFSRMPLYVSTRSGVTPEFLTEEATRVKGRAKIDLVIVDHMQLMGSTGKVKSDYEKFTSISRATKGIAAELKVPLLLISQTSRANSMDRRAELEVSDLRGSGAIEEDAAVVMLLYYDAEDFKAAKADPTGERLKRGPIKTWLKLGKNRYGPQGTYELLNHFKAQTRFDPMEVA
ncbi:MAG: AAA family ATPase [Acidobacteriota bacterium]|nr:AAA family ATPase [Acidobacteriota bacterium]